MKEESFMLALRRFVTRRSLPRIMMSDNANTFKAAVESNQQKVVDRGTELKFISNRVPWFGGWWKRLIGLTKNAIKKVFGRSLNVTIDMRRTIVNEIERMLNNRPMTYISTDITDLQPLTPSHLLNGRRLDSLPHQMDNLENFHNSNHSSCNKKLQRQHQLIEHFRTRWRNEYLTSLQEFHSATALPRNQIEEDMQSLFNRSDLRCPMECNDGTSTFQMSCCICQSKPDVNNLGNLRIVNNRKHYGPEIVNNGGKHEFYALNHTYGRLQVLPWNICNFKGLFTIDLSFNKIKTIHIISCLTNIDTLLLRGNNIQYMHNDTFMNMRFLRIIDLSSNKVSLMDPGFLYNMHGSLFYLNLSFNKMSTLDITNGIAAKQDYFCLVDYSHNSIKSLTNKKTWKLKMNTTLGHGGMVNLSNNSLTAFFDLNTLRFLGFEQLFLIGKLMNYGFDLRDNKWNCDCKIYQFAKAAEPFAKKAEIDFRENNINSLHRSMAELNPCNIYLDTVEMQCKCEDIWLQQWLPKSDSECHKNVHVLCRLKGQLISIKSMTKKDLGCRIPNTNFIWISTIIVAAFIIVVLLSASIFSFRFEILIIGRKFIKYFRGTSYPMTLFYDVYIACNEEDEKIRLWLTSHLLPSLEVNNMLRVFWPCRDSEIGVPREEEMINVMSNTQTFIIILSEEYKGPVRWNEKEWKHAWHNYTHDLNREIIIINYDLLEANEIAKRYLGAFLRIGQFIDFSNHKKSIENEIASLIIKQDKNLKKYERKISSHSQIDDETFPFLKQHPLYSEFQYKE
ncbi:unnamed protein product [Mytilus edulis]|uniref:TIR domain-containing protein n=1 Tax=Mytilus edulis TaxID=6550 RepID=A0A8S3TAH0_MYTED|nr:unnamed protein product [Mytilus edulis]